VKRLFFITGEVTTASLVASVSPDEAKHLALPPSAIMALESAESEAVVASLLVRSGALISALQRR